MTGDLLLADAYAAGLADYARLRDESARNAAYELGRRGLSNHVGLLDFMQMHHDVAGKLDMADPTIRKLTEEFLAEAMAPYEMMLRGYEEANDKLMELNHVLATQNAELSDAQVAADAANRELETFSYSVAHDLRAPLRAIDGFCHALLADHALQLDTEGQQYLDRVVSNTQRMGQLIEDLLALSRVTRVPLRRTEVDLGAMARRVFATLKEADPERQVTLQLTEPLLASCDARLVQVVLENVIGNAWKFTRKRPDALIEMGKTQTPNGATFFVKDNGVGFDNSQANKLFVAFQRLHSRTEFEGTGIGLATAHRVIRNHGGVIWAESKPGEGTTLFFTLGPDGERV